MIKKFTPAWERSKRLMDKVVGTMKVDLVKTEYPYTNKKGVEVMGYNYALKNH